ncbi:MAG: signal peptidase I [Gammaproteobacteria bacterium]
MIHFDFEFLLVVATAFTGLIWLIDVLFFAAARKKAATSKSPHEPILLEYSKSFFPVLFAVLVLRALLFEPFRIPSGSMMPSLLVGDFILVNKFAYGLRLPITHTRITRGEKPKRGDVAVFRYPEDETLDYIKRIIGLPGDHVSYYNRRLAVNGKPLKIKFSHKYEGLGDRNNMVEGSGCDKVGAECNVYYEKIGSTNHAVMTNPEVGFSFDGELFVPEGQYFVMGDNRDHSNDSRYWGFVPQKNLVGKAIMIWMHWDWRSGGNGLDFSRLGNRISE